MYHPNVASQNIDIKIKSADFLETVPQATTHMDINLDQTSRVLGTIALSLSFYNNGSLLDKQSIIVRTNATQPFIQSKMSLKKGAIINYETVEIVTKNIRGNPSNAFHTLKDVIGKELTVGIPKQALLTHWNTQAVPTIREGNPVILILKNNAIKLKVKGKALSDGNIGDIINVESHLKNRKYLKGEIVDSQHINIQTINF